MITSNKEVNFVSAVIYVGSSTREIKTFLRSIHKVFDANFQNYEFICVNDNANSSLLQEIREFKEERKILALSIVNMAVSGYEESMVAGVDASIGDYVFEFDSACMDYDNSLIMKAYEKTAEGFDIVSVKTPKKGSSFMSKIFYSIYNRYSGTPYELATERFRVLSRRAVNRVEAFSKIIPYRKAVYAFSGVKSASLEYEPLSQNINIPEKNNHEKWNVASDAIILFTNIAYKISLLFSGLMASVMFGFGLYVVFVYFSQNKPVEGWAPLMGFMCLGFMAMFIVQAFVFKYLEMILRLEFKKQQYIVSSIERI
ncbi:MAG: glycosyltransferase [Synergistaceae bacterium]|nr:glycosyltransferase [Synergistaceae bacterium]